MMCLLSESCKAIGSLRVFFLFFLFCRGYVFYYLHTDLWRATLARMGVGMCGWHHSLGAMQRVHKTPSFFRGLSVKSGSTVGRIAFLITRDVMGIKFLRVNVICPSCVTV
jgi:hypothetical protein